MILSDWNLNQMFSSSIFLIELFSPVSFIIFFFAAILSSSFSLILFAFTFLALPIYGRSPHFHQNHISIESMLIFWWWYSSWRQHSQLYPTTLHIKPMRTIIVVILQIIVINIPILHKLYFLFDMFDSSSSPVHLGISIYIYIND